MHFPTIINSRLGHMLPANVSHGIEVDDTLLKTKLMNNHILLFFQRSLLYKLPGFSAIENLNGKNKIIETPLI